MQCIRKLLIWLSLQSFQLHWEKKNRTFDKIMREKLFRLLLLLFLFFVAVQKEKSNKNNNNFWITHYVRYISFSFTSDTIFLIPIYNYLYVLNLTWNILKKKKDCCVTDTYQIHFEHLCLCCIILFFSLDWLVPFAVYVFFSVAVAVSILSYSTLLYFKKYINSTHVCEVINPILCI